MMAPDPLDNNRNWVRAAMGLKHLKEGLESFVEDEVLNLHSSFLQDIRSSHGLSPTTFCSLCKLENVLPCPTKGFCNRNRGGCNFHINKTNCANNLCDKIAAKIMSQHRFDSPCWKNTDVTKWCSSSWEIAKCFMPNGYSGKMSAKDTDCKGIMSVIINCLSLQRSISTYIDPPSDIFSKMSDTRNKIIHSATLEVTNAELQQYIDDMIAILNDSKTIQNHPDAVTARTNLNQIKTNKFVISSRDELELRKKAIEAIEQKQKELLEQCQQQQTELQSKLDQTLTSLTQTESASQQKQSDLESKLDQTLATLTLEGTTSKQKQTDLQSSLDQTLASLTQAEGASKQQQAKLQSKVDEATNLLSHNHAICERNQKELQSKCDKTMTSLTQAERQCQRNKDDMQSSQGQLHMKLNSLQTQMTQVLEVLKKCQLDIDQVRLDLQKGTDKHEKHVNILENRLRNRLLLQTRLRKKYKYQSNIPLSPFLKNIKVDINKVYQNLVIRPDLIHDPNVNKQAKHQKAVNGYRDIFFNKGEPCKNIFVIGNGGIGKTTWCLKLLSSWIKCGTNDEDKDFLQRFKYVFYVPLRYTKQESQINDMIKSYLFPDENDLINAVKDVFLEEPEHCLVLLDGLDEWKLPSAQRINNMGLPHDPLHSKYTTLITSRPWKLEILRLEPTAIDKAVEIKGLDEYGISQLAGHIIDQLKCDKNRHSNELKVFMDYIRNRKMPMIEVPLVLSCFVYLWYDNDSICETFAGLYGKLAVNLFKTAEGDKRRIRQNLEVSKLLPVKDIIEKINEKTSEIPKPIPVCLKGLGESYTSLLFSLGKLAFFCLLSKNIDTFLVFTQESIEEYMSAEELEVALYIGILSQSQTIGDSTGEKFSISFMHKTFQEFFAAVYMVLATEHSESGNIIIQFTDYCKQIANVFEVENILICICGMDPALACELTKLISDMYKNDTIKWGVPPRLPYKEMLHQTLLRCVREEHLYSNESNHVYIVNHFITGRMENRNNINAETLGYISLNHKRVPMCLDIELCSNAEENTINKLSNMKDRSYRYTRDPEEDKKYMYEYEDAICRCLSGIHTLEKLVIQHGIMTLYNDKGCLRISECINRLECQTLQLQNITGNLGYIDLLNNTELTDLSLIRIHVEELSLPQDGCIETIKLEYIKHPQGDPVRLTLNINNQLCLKHLTLKAITRNVGDINLSYNSKLTELTMTSIQIEELSLPKDGCLETIKLISIKCPQGDQGRLTLNMNNQPYLENLELDDITGNVGHINLSNNSKLNELTMISLQIEELSLPQHGCLETIKLKSFIHLQGDQGLLKLNMKNQSFLKHLTLKDITGKVGHVNLSNNSKLTKLTIISLQIEELSLPQHGCLETIKLKSFIHLQRDQGLLKLNMKNQSCLKHLTLEDITGKVGHINLSNNSKLTELTMISLQIEELSLPQHGCLETIKLKSFIHLQGDQGLLKLNMKNQSCLETIKLEYIKHPQGDPGRLTLNINNQLCLKHLTLEDITGKVGHINLSNNLKWTELTMISLQIEELSLPQDGCLRRVVLKSIKHPDGDQGSLTINMNYQLYLKHLTLDDIKGNVGHINLSNNSQLKSLTMTSLQIEELSLPHDGCLERVLLKSIKHPQGDQERLTLNMDNQQQLYLLTLEDITENVGHIDLSNNSKLRYFNMRSLQLEEISLPHDGCLWRVELKYLKHPQGDQGSLKININNQPHLNKFTLHDISCNIDNIDLSKNTKLTDVSVISVPLVNITVPRGVAIVEE